MACITQNCGNRFNPRAREGRDASSKYVAKVRQCFNPRAREGRDLLMKMI